MAGKDNSNNDGKKIRKAGQKSDCRQRAGSKACVERAVKTKNDKSDHCVGCGLLKKHAG